MKAVALAGIALVLSGCAESAKATADRISTKSELIGGPKALGQVGDYLLQNDKIRVIVHGPGANRGSTIFGGSLIDADLQRPHAAAGGGNDQLGEIFPVFLFEAVDPTSFEVTNDGSDGNPAIVTVEGVGGDLLQMVAVMNTGLLFPPDLRFREEYKLSAGKSYVEITTTITNTGATSHPLPYLNPPDLAGLGLNIPGLDALTLSVPMGHLALFGAENDLFASGGAGFNVRFAIEDQYPLANGFPAFPGLLTEYLATRGDGVSYGIVVPDSTANYPSSFAPLYAPQPVTSHSLLLPYIYSSVTAVFHASPPAALLPGESFSFPLYFIVGRGDVGSVLDTIHEIRGTPTGTFAGRVLDEQTLQGIEHASVVVQGPGGAYVSQYDTDARGDFRGQLGAGSYTYRIVTGTRETPVAEAFQIRASHTTAVRSVLPAPARLGVQVRDSLGRRVPSKVTLVGEFPVSSLGQDPRTFLYDLALGEPYRPTAFDPQRAEFIEKTFYLHDGILEAEVRPGRYFLVTSRGMEYDMHSETVQLQSGARLERTVTLQKTVDTAGWIGADLHLHAKPSLDSEMTLEDRVASLAGEGLEFGAATDHNFLSDYTPALAKLSLEEWLTTSVGLELTTFEMGHFNGFPLRIDPGNVRGGAFNWAGEAPDRLFDQLRALGKYGPAETIVEVNHPRDGTLGYFSQFNMDNRTGESVPRIGLRGVFAPYRPEFAPERFSLNFDAIEILNGKRADITHDYRAPDPLPPPPIPSPAPTPGEVVLDQYGQVAFPGAMEDWFGLLNLGYRHTGIGNSDSHRGLTHEPGYPRTFFHVGAGKDQQGRYDERDIVKAIRSHRGVMTNGPMVDFTVEGQPIGSDVTVTDGSAELRIHVTSANWVAFDRVRVYANGVAVVDETVPVTERHDYTKIVSLALTTSDTWALVEVNGSENLFPVLAPQEFEPLSAAQVITALGSALDLSGLDPYGNLRPRRIFQALPIAVTNPIWIDHDGDGFQPRVTPQPAPPARPASAATRRNLREDFDAIPGAR